MSLKVYKASAGSGKTFKLALEYITLALITDNPKAFTHILAVTFTNKATAEMKERILTQLYKLANNIPDRDFQSQLMATTGQTAETLRERAGRVLETIVHDFDHFRVETIDSFFQSMLSNLAYDLGLARNFRVSLDTNEAIARSVERMLLAAGVKQRSLARLTKTILDYIYLAPPTLVSKYPRKEGQKPGYDYYGVYFEWMNPLANLERGTQVESVRDYVTINARPTWHIIPGLTLKGQVGYRIASGMDKKDRNAYVFLDYFSGNESGTFGAVKSATYTTRTSYWMVGATLDWTKEFGDHRINILGGWNEEVDRRNGWDDVALLSFFGKAYYSYKDKYLAEVGIRRDGSSLFGDGHKWGNFPSVAVGWNVNREPWMQNARFIDNFKIRASYGMLGNNNVALYRYQTIIDNSGNEIVNGNPDLTWEKVKILDAGVDLSLFGQKLEVTFDWFRKVTDDMIVNVPSTPSSGLLAAPMNVGKAEVKGYEIGVGFNHSFTKDIDFSINLGYSYNKSKWLEITNDELINGNTIYRKGHAIKEYYGYQADHLLTQDDLDFRVPIIGGYDGATTAQLPGDIRYVDTNGDKVITTDDRVPLGDQDPHSVYYGNLSFRWKNLDFDMQVNGVGYVPIFYQGLISNPLDPEYGGTPQRWHLDHWKAENPDRNAKLPRVTTDPGNNALLSTFWKENGAFVRIKYMQLGYNFKALAKKIHAGNFRVYVNVQNPFTFTKVELIDPETKGTHTTYPMFKTYSVGLNVNF